MKLVYLGEELDTNIEHEILSTNECGFNITILYSSESWISKHNGKQTTVIFNNCTEVHHLWCPDYMGGASIAFESDILSTGFTHNINDIESVHIELLNKIEK